MEYHTLFLFALGFVQMVPNQQLGQYLMIQQSIREFTDDDHNIVSLTFCFRSTTALMFFP
jgi:hypothetical protein